MGEVVRGRVSFYEVIVSSWEEGRFFFFGEVRSTAENKPWLWERGERKCVCVCVGVILHVGSFILSFLFQFSFGSVYLYMGGAFFLDWDCVIGMCGRISAFYGS